MTAWGRGLSRLAVGLAQFSVVLTPLATLDYEPYHPASLDYSLVVLGAQCPQHLDALERHVRSAFSLLET